MSKFHGWVITHDSINTEPGDVTRVGISQRDGQEGGFRYVTVTEGLHDAADCVDPVRFRTLDDDGEVYYSGVISRDWLEGDESKAFGPLAYAQADAGATDLQFRNARGEWETL